MIDNTTNLDTEINKRMAMISAAAAGRFKTPKHHKWITVLDSIRGSHQDILNQLFDGTDLAAYNPSLLKHNDRLYISLRVTDYKQESIFKTGTFAASQVYIGELNPTTLELLWLKHFPYGSDVPDSCKEGYIFEDGRLYSTPTGVKLIGALTIPINDVLSTHQGIASVNLNDETITIEQALPKPKLYMPEKNWSVANPEQDSDSPVLAYSPTQTYRDYETHGAPYTGFIHGRTQLIKLTEAQGAGYFSLVGHISSDLTGVNLNTVTPFNLVNKRSYVTHFAWWDDELQLKKLSEAFKIASYPIEFFSGLTWLDEATILASYGIEDEDYGLVSFKLSDAIKTLEPYDVQYEDRFMLY